MGNRPMKTRCGAPAHGKHRAENDGDPVSPSASESSSSKLQGITQVHCAEVFIVHISQKEKEVYILVPAEETEGERPQEDSKQSGEMAPVAMTSGSSDVASGVLEEANLSPELTNSTTDTSVRTEVQPVRLDLFEACQLLVPEMSPGPPPKTCRASSSGEHPSGCSAVSEEGVAAELASVGTLSAEMAEPWKGIKDLHPSSDLSKGSEVPESGQKASGKMDLELPLGNVQGATEEQATGQRELDEATSEETLQRTAGLHPHLILAETPDRPSVVMAALANEQLAEGLTHAQNHLSLSVSEMEGEIPEDSSAVGSLKEREDLCSTDEVSTETELQPNVQKLPCRMCHELTTENTQVVAKEPATVQRQLDNEASPEKAVHIDFHLDSALVETSGGTSSMGAAPGMKQLAEEQSIPGHDLPLAVTEMEGKVHGDGSVAEDMGGMTKALSSQLKMLPLEVQDKMLAQVEVGDKTAHPFASNTPLEKKLEHTLTPQSVSTIKEKPNNHVQLLGDTESLDAAQPDGDSPTLEAMLPGAHIAVQAQPPAEMTVVHLTPTALLGTAEAMKKLEEASPALPLGEETLEQAGLPEAPLPPKMAPVSGTPLWEAHREEDAGFFDATLTCEAAEVQAWTSIPETRDKRDSKDEPIQETPVGSPRLIAEEAEEETLVHINADSAEASKMEDSSLYQ